VRKIECTKYNYVFPYPREQCFRIGEWCIKCPLEVVKVERSD